MRPYIYTLLLLMIVLIFGCNPDWEDYYKSYSETVNENVWSAIDSDPRISTFAGILKEYEIDTLFNSDIPYTVITPTNEAFEAFLDTIDLTLLKYHICEHFISLASVQGKRRIQTLTKKFLLIERINNVYLFDGIEVKESPLYRNGKYFVVDEVIKPKPNLYEYYKVTNPLLSIYIDSKDSIVLDRELSVPIGYDDQDKTIYDSVINIINIFEEEFFEVKHEFRDRSATIVFPKQEDYHEALNVMANDLGDRYTDYKDIPLDWQNDVLMPVLIEHGVFLYELELEEFIPEPGQKNFKMMNIVGDSVKISYMPTEKTQCSNGYAYNYTNFQIPDSLYQLEAKFEGEALIEFVSGVAAWNESVSVTSTVNFLPSMQYIATASNDSIIQVRFPLGYSDQFDIEFQSTKLFPRNYIMEVKTHMKVGGVYDIYVNDELLRTFDYNEFKKNFFVLPSVEPGVWYIPDSKDLNSFDMLVENVTEYGPATIRFEYKGPGVSPSNGLIIDYIEFRPYN